MLSVGIKMPFTQARTNWSAFWLKGTVVVPSAVITGCFVWLFSRLALLGLPFLYLLQLLSDLSFSTILSLHRWPFKYNKQTNIYRDITWRGECCVLQAAVFMKAVVSTYFWLFSPIGRSIYLLIFSLFLLFIYLFLAVLGLHFCARAFSSRGKWGATLHRGARASHYRGLSCCGAQAPDAQAQ